MTKKRGFEIVSQYQGAGLNLPKRGTQKAAGYDFEAAEETVIPSIWRAGAGPVLRFLAHQAPFPAEELQQAEKGLKPTLVATGIKAYMLDEEYLQLNNRSGNPLKAFLLLANGVGVIDSDYYNNPANEGHIMFQFINFGFRDYVIKKGERIGQGIFLPFLKADDDLSGGQRTGGFGSTGKN